MNRHASDQYTTYHLMEEYMCMWHCLISSCSIELQTWYTYLEQDKNPHCTCTTYHQACKLCPGHDSAECAWLGKGYSCRHTVSTDTWKHACMNKQSSTYRQPLTTHFAMCVLDSAPRSPSIYTCPFFRCWRPILMKPTLNNGSRDGPALDLPCYSTTFHNRTSCTRLHNYITWYIRVVLAKITVYTFALYNQIHTLVCQGQDHSSKQSSWSSMQGPFWWMCT